jgi:DNA modification methylase
VSATATATEEIHCRTARTPVLDSASLHDILEATDAGLIEPERPDLAPLVNWSGLNELPIHRWLRYREGFSPRLIDELHLGRRLLDPFCGSGSIMVGAAQQHRSSVGIDVNPLAAFAARVKLAPLAPTNVRAARRFLQHFEAAAKVTTPWPLPSLRISDKVFEPEVLDTLLRLRSTIEELPASRPLHDFLLLAWLAILQEVGSYFKEGNGIKYRNKKRLKSGYVVRPDGEWQLDRFGPDQSGFVLEAFRTQLSRMVNDVPEWDGGAWEDQQIYSGNSLEIVETLNPESFDSVIFSPPYANRFDYFESQKVELWFGGFVQSYEEMISLRKRSVRSHLGAALDSETPAIPEIEALIKLIDPDSYAIRMRVPALIRGYFADMARILRGCRRVLPDGGSCHVVVGNSAYGGVIVPSDSLIAHIGLAAGFSTVRVIPVRHLTVAPQQRNELIGREFFMRESIVTLT